MRDPSDTEKPVTDLRALYQRMQRDAKRLKKQLAEAAKSSREARATLADIEAMLAAPSAETITRVQGLIRQQIGRRLGATASSERPAPGMDELFESSTRSTAPTIHYWKYRTLLAVERQSAGDVILINDTRSQNNIGCQATTEKLITGLSIRGVNVHHSFMLSELSEIAHQIGLEAESIPGVEDAVSRFLSWEVFSPYRALLSRSRAAVVNGEGSFYDRSGKGLAACVLAVAAQRLGLRVAIINHSAELEHPDMRSYVTAAFKHADLVDFREPVSQRRLPPQLSALATTTSADMAFLHALDDAEPLTLPAVLPMEFPEVATARDLGVRPVVLTGSSAIMRPDRDPIRLDAFTRLCESILASGRPLCLYGADVSDCRLLRPVAMKLGLPIIPAHRHIGWICSLFASASAMISGRWHASILAASCGTPLILGDANFFKTEALRDMLDIDLPMFRYRTLDDDIPAILHALDQIDAAGDELRNAVRSHARRHAASARSTLDRVVSLVGS